MLQVRLITDPFDLAAYSEHQVTELLPFLREQFEAWPETARLYRGQVAEACDVTPRTEGDVLELERATDGLYYVVVYPGDPITAIIAVVATLVLTAAVLLFLTPKIPTAPNGSDSQSSNNSLGNRANKPRPNGRIPDIFGQVISIPELLTVPLLVFEDNLEVEYCYMAVGRGEYVVTDVKDGDTPLDQIAGAGAAFYGPGTAPGSGAPFLEIGTEIAEPLLNVIKLNDVNGQTLRPPNATNLSGNGTVRFVAPDKIQSNGVDLSVFEPGDQLNVAGTGGLGLEGVYNVLAATTTQITLSNPAAVNPAWGTFTSPSDYVSPQLYTTGVSWIGSFVVDLDTLTQVVANFVAPQGLYRINGKNGNELTQTVQVLLELTPIDDNDLPIGAPESFTTSLSGDPSDKSQKGATLYAAPTFTGRCQVRARRLTNHDLGKDNDTVVDDVKWRDCFATAPPGASDFGNVTTVHSRTYATASALSVKERKLNCRATRKVLVRNGDALGPGLAASQSAADIICHMAVDPYIGGRPLDEVDVDQIHDAVDTAVLYFSLDAAGEFNYTFDQDNISFEEMVQSVAVAVFCTAYRQGNKLRLLLEIETQDATILFNHRNKVPGSETRTVRFGALNDYDGVELDYVDPGDGAKLTLYVPTDRTAVRAKKLEILGVSSSQQASLHAYRGYNKIQHQNTTTEFTALPEASQLVVNERIEVADNTRPDIWDGYVLDQGGLVLELSQPFQAAPQTAYFIFLQTASGGVQGIPITPVDLHHVALQEATSEPLPLDPDVSADVFYQIVADDGTATSDVSGFLVSEKGAFDKRTLSMQAINYDARYYKNDHDFGVQVNPVLVTKQLFDAEYWTCDGPRSMSFCVITDHATNSLTATWRSRRKSDLCGIIWFSADRYNHVYQRRVAKFNYSGAVLTFTVAQAGAIAAFNDDLSGLILTVNANVDGVLTPFYVRLELYATGVSATGGNVTLNFNTLMSGFDNDIPVPVTDIQSMFIAGVTTGYVEGDAGPMASPQDASITLSNINCTGNMQVYEVDIPDHDLGMATGYDDMYNICPKVAVKNMSALGYHRLINHYVGMSHYYEQKYDAGLGRFQVTTDADAPTYGLFNQAALLWHQAFAEAAQAAGFEVIFAISFELFSEAAVTDWMQRDWDGNLGVTGYDPPSYLVSPCNVDGMNWLKSVFREFSKILDDAGLPVLIQVGEPWWWYNVGSQKPCVYDFPTKLAFNADTGLFAPEFTSINDTSTGTPHDEFKAWLRDKLGDTVLALRAHVRAAYPSAQVSVLFFLPSILGEGSGIMGTINYPEAQYAYPNLDFFQTEAYDWLINGAYTDALRAFSLPTAELGYPQDKVEYLAGFVPDQQLGSVIAPGYNLNRDGLLIWRAVFGNAGAANAAGVTKVTLWSYTQVMRDGIIYHPDQEFKSFFWRGKFKPVLPKALRAEGTGSAPVTLTGVEGDTITGVDGTPITLV